MKLRYYQQEAHDAAISWIKKKVEPAVLELATASGKSHIIAAIAHTVHKMSKGKHVLCLAPSSELVIQNREKYLLTGKPASIFSASAGGKCLRHPVVFGTPGTVKNKIRRFGEKFAMVIIDESHSITPTIKKIISAMREENQNLRVIGLSATPYRMNTGYIYAMDEDNNTFGDDEAVDPYFTKKLFTVPARQLIDEGFLTQPVIGDASDSYDTLHMKLNRMGKFNQDDIDKAYHGQGRKTSRIIADIIEKSKHRNGVMIFAATVQHANECMESLPPGLSAIVTGKTPKGERKKILSDFKARKLKYLVNVSVLTTGFDATHVDVVAILRATESVGLLQQIIGRGLRVDENKDNCLVLDYAKNIERHAPDGDIFAPIIKTRFTSEEKNKVAAVCESCGHKNFFSARPNKEGFFIDKNGYFIDLDKNRIENNQGQSIPAHFGRRCKALHSAPQGKMVQCDYKWSFKQCPECDYENDIAARYCRECKSELVDPNEKLVIEFAKFKKDPTRIQTDKIISFVYRDTMSAAGNECIRIDVVTDYRSFSNWIMKDPKNGRQAKQLEMFQFAIKNNETPKTVTYRKEESGFYKILDYNRKTDEEVRDENTKMA